MADDVLKDAVLLLIRLTVNFTLLFLPVAALCLVAARFRVLDTVRLGAIALAGTALSGYCVFWSWFLSWRLVRPIGFTLEAGALLCVVLTARKLDEKGRLALQPLLAPVALVFTAALLILAATYTNGGLKTPLLTASMRFSHPLPDDNMLPFVFGYSMMNSHKVPMPLRSDWRASDRPPLQTAITLGQFFGLIGPTDVAYQALSVLLQSLWIFSLWLLLYARNVHRYAIRLVLVGCLFSSFIFVNSAFVWPKLLAAAYLLGFLALLLGCKLTKHAQSGPLMAVTAGCLLAWSFLSHGGTAFAFLGLLPIALLGRFISIKVAVLTLATAGVLYSPWIAFQKFYDPPGNRLIKMHVAGVEPIDDRTAMRAITDGYRAISFNRVVEHKERNLSIIFNTFQFWPTLRQFFFELPKQDPERSLDRIRLAKTLNVTQFFYFPSTLGFFVIGIPLLLLGVFPRWRSEEWKLAILLLLFTVLADIFWALIMFGPGTTVIHAGAYATILASFAASILGLWAVSRWLAASVTAAQICLFAYIQVFVLIPAQGTFQYGMIGLSMLALIGIICLLPRIGVRQ